MMVIQGIVEKGEQMSLEKIREWKGRDSDWVALQKGKIPFGIPPSIIMLSLLWQFMAGHMKQLLPESVRRSQNCQTLTGSSSPGISSIAVNGLNLESSVHLELCVY